VSVTIITKTFKVDGTPTDCTSMLLSDPTGTYGVRRQDTQEVVVADGTAMTKIATGVYSHTFDDPAYNLIYEYWIEALYNGATYRVEGTVVGSTTPAADVSSNVGKVRLRIGDLGSVIFEDDAYIEEFLAANDDNVLAACSDACLAIANQAALLHKAQKIGNWSLDQKGMAAAYRDMAREFQAQIANEPAYAGVEQAVSDFAARDIIGNEALREG